MKTPEQIAEEIFKKSERCYLQPLLQRKMLTDIIKGHIVEAIQAERDRKIPWPSDEEIELQIERRDLGDWPYCETFYETVEWAKEFVEKKMSGQ